MKDIEKFSKQRDYTFAANNHKNKKDVKSTFIETGEIDYFYLLCSAQRDLKINFGIVKMCCEGLNRVKSGKSQLNGKFYKFHYVNEIPERYNRTINISRKNK